MRPRIETSARSAGNSRARRTLLTLSVRTSPSRCRFRCRSTWSSRRFRSTSPRRRANELLKAREAVPPGRLRVVIGVGPVFCRLRCGSSCGAVAWRQALQLPPRGGIVEPATRPATENAAPAKPEEQFTHRLSFGIRNENPVSGYTTPAALTGVASRLQGVVPRRALGRLAHRPAEVSARQARGRVEAADSRLPGRDAPTPAAKAGDLDAARFFVARCVACVPEQRDRVRSVYRGGLHLSLSGAGGGAALPAW